MSCAILQLVRMKWPLLLLRLAFLTTIAIVPAPATAETSRQTSEMASPSFSTDTLPAIIKRDPHLELGWQAYQRGDLVEALKAYREAVTSSPDDASLWYDIGCLHALNQEGDQAKDALSQALILNPRFAIAHDALGQVDEEAGDLERALAAYRRARELEPTRAKFLRHLARVQLRLDKTTEAQETLLALVRFEPSDVEARYQLGVLELRANAPDLAVTDFRKVLERSPNHVMAWNGLGLSYTRIGAFGEAMQALEKAQALEPENARTQTNLGIVAATQHHWSDAREAWQRALELDPHFAPAARNLDALNSLTTSASTTTSSP